MIKKIVVLILICFTSSLLCPPAPIFAVSTTGTLKIFSETKGIKVYIDEELKGTDVIEIQGLAPGDHYVKITKDDAVLYSELVKVSAGVTSAVLIKTKAVTQEQVLDKLYKEQQEYKQQKLDIMLSKGMASTGSSYTSSSYFPGYYSIYGSGWTTSSTTAYETTDWKIIKGGVQEISDRDFAQLVGDKDTVARMDKDMDDYGNIMNWGAGICLTGLLMVIAGGAAAFSGGAASDSGAVVCAVGFVPLIVGYGMLSKDPPSGHYVNPGTAAKLAFDYNQKLKQKLGLPENYEPK